MLILTFRPMPRAIVMISAVFAASAALLAATDRAHAFARVPVVKAGTVRPTIATRMPSAARPDNLELLVKVLDTRNLGGGRSTPGYATGETMVHIESGLPATRGPGKTPSTYKLKFFDKLGRGIGIGAQPYTPPIGWKFSNLKVRVTR